MTIAPQTVNTLALVETQKTPNGRSSHVRFIYCEARRLATAARTCSGNYCVSCGGRLVSLLSACKQYTDEFWHNVRLFVRHPSNTCCPQLINFVAKQVWLYSVEAAASKGIPGDAKYITEIPGGGREQNKEVGEGTKFTGYINVLMFMSKML